MSWAQTLSPERRRTLATTLDDRGAEHLRYAGGDREFAMFLLVADARCLRRLGVSIFDLEDACWRDFYDDGLTPAEALRAARDTA